MFVMLVGALFVRVIGAVDRCIFAFFGGDVVAKAATDTDGWSGREISKLAIAWQSAAYGTSGAELDLETFQAVVQQQAAAKNMKDMWLEEARVEKMTRDL